MEKRYLQHALRLLEQYDESHHRMWKALWKNLQHCQRTAPASAVHLWDIDGPFGDKDCKGCDGCDDCDDCDDCSYVDDLCLLIHSLVKDIIHLEEEVVR